MSFDQVPGAAPYVGPAVSARPAQVLPARRPAGRRGRWWWPLIPAVVGVAGWAWSSLPSGGSAADAASGVPSAWANLVEAPTFGSQTQGVVLLDVQIGGWEQGVAAGTGLVVGQRGLVLTNAHVVTDAASVQVTDPATRSVYPAHVVSSSSKGDVALVQIDQDVTLATVSVDGDGVEVGDAVTAIGNSAGAGVLTAASGTVSAVDVSAQIAAEHTMLLSSAHQVGHLLLMDLYVVPGDSGGAILDSDGQVVAVTTATTTDGSQQAFAIPIGIALTLASDLMP